MLRSWMAVPLLFEEQSKAWCAARTVSIRTADHVASLLFNASLSRDG